MTLTRAKFDELTHDLVEITAEPVRRALSDAGITESELGQVLLVGGSSRIPAVQDKVRQLTGKEPLHNLDVWGSKSRVVPTSFGALKMAAFETPVPTFADWGKRCV